VTNLSSIRTVEDLSDPAEIGLASPEIQIVAHHAGGETRIEFGSSNPPGTGVYVRRDGRDVFLTDPSAKSTVDVSVFDVRKKEFFDFEPADITAIAVTKPGKTLRLRRVDTGWAIEEPDRAADPDQVESLLNRLRALRATTFFDTAEQRDGLNLPPSPRLVIEVTGTASKTVSFYAPRGGASNSVYAKTDTESIYEVSASVVDELPLEVAALRDLRLVRLPAQDVNEIEVKTPAESYRVVRREQDARWEMDGRLLTSEAAALISEFVATLVTARGESVVSESVAGAPKEAFDRPMATIGLHRVGDLSRYTVVIGAATKGGHYAHAGSGPVMLVASDLLANIPLKDSLQTEPVAP